MARAWGAMRHVWAIVAVVVAGLLAFAGNAAAAGDSWTGSLHVAHKEHHYDPDTGNTSSIDGATTWTITGPGTRTSDPDGTLHWRQPARWTVNAWTASQDYPDCHIGFSAYSHLTG